MHIKRAAKQSFADLGEECVLLNVETGVYYGLEAVGRRIWELIEPPCSLAQVVERLVQEYDVSAEACTAETERLLRELADVGLVELSANGRTAGH